MKTLDNNYFYTLFEYAGYNWDVSDVENKLENDLKNNYECKNTDYPYIIIENKTYVKESPKDLLIPPGWNNYY